MTVTINGFNHIRYTGCLQRLTLLCVAGACLLITAEQAGAWSGRLNSLCRWTHHTFGQGGLELATQLSAVRQSSRAV